MITYDSNLAVIIEAAYQYYLTNNVGIINAYKMHPLHLSLFRFYLYIFQNQNRLIYFDEFNFIPVEYDVIDNLVLHAIASNTLFKDKLSHYPFAYSLRYEP